ATGPRCATSPARCRRAARTARSGICWRSPRAGSSASSRSILVGWAERSEAHQFHDARAGLMGFAALSPSYVHSRLSSPGEARLRDRVGLIELGKMAGAGDRLDLGLAGNPVREFIGVAARHDAVLFAPEEQRRRLDQR